MAQKDFIDEKSIDEKFPDFDIGSGGVRQLGLIIRAR